MTETKTKQYSLQSGDYFIKIQEIGEDLSIELTSITVGGFQYVQLSREDGLTSIWAPGLENNEALQFALNWISVVRRAYGVNFNLPLGFGDGSVSLERLIQYLMDLLDLLEV